MRKITVLLITFLSVLLIGTTLSAETGVRYNTYTESNNRLVRTQTAYTPVTSIDNIYGVELGEPSDIHIDQNNMIYIVSRYQGAGRLIVFSLETEEAQVYGEDFLINPTGVHVNQAGEIFIADRGGQAAYRLDPSGVVIQTYTRPTSPLFGPDDFQPRKIVSDTRGNVYILNQGQRGLAQFAPNGEFLGYYGTNTITPSLRNILQYTFFTEEQQDRLFNLSPPEISNVAIDQRGLIHTSSLGVDNHGIKRLNISGENLLPAMLNLPDLVDLFVGPIGNIYAISASGEIYEYDSEGNLLFAFGGQDVSNQIKGLFNVPTAIAVDSDFNIFVLDRGSSELQIFMPTQFANLVHTALESYQEGFYLDSQGPWNEVLKMNDFFDLAHAGLGNAYYSLSEYDLALEAYEIAFERGGYSDAFWEVRNQWLLDNVSGFLVALFAILFIYIVNLKLKFMRFVTGPIKKTYAKAKTKSKTLSEVTYVFYYLRNPSDATYEIKRKQKVSMFSATILLLIYISFYIYYIYNLSFLFNMRNVTTINVGEELLVVLLPLFLWVISNYLIGSIREGEGRFKDVYITTIFSLAPYFFALPILTILSQGLTYNEGFLMTFLSTISIGLTGIYFFFMVKETHYYSMKETVSSILISAFTMAMILLSTFIIYMLLNELGILIKDIFMEVYYRV